MYEMKIQKLNLRHNISFSAVVKEWKHKPTSSCLGYLEEAVSETLKERRQYLHPAIIQNKEGQTEFLMQ